MTVEVRDPKLRLAPARLRPADVARLGSAGLRSRPTRVILSALGIAIGIGAMIAVVGISESSRVQLDRELAKLGTNLLTIEPGQSFSGETAHLPEEAVAMVARIGPVTAVSAIGRVPAKVYRNDRIPAAQSGGIAVLATHLDLLSTVGAELETGAFLNEATARYPTVVLGASAAERLGVGAADGRQQVWLGSEWFTVVGTLHPVALAPELDGAALVGWPVAGDRLGFDGYPTTVYTRSRDDAVESVRGVLAATANPEHPNQVAVSRPSDALAARRSADATLSGLLLGLGGVALLVGGVGVANTMIISVLERRAEIGLRRSLGATRGQIRLQFFVESLFLSALGGVGGALLGIVATGIYAGSRGWPAVVPLWATAGGVVATLVIGAAAGLYPALRAARLPPTQALAAP